jgi:hypothetical protein
MHPLYGAEHYSRGHRLYIRSMVSQHVTKLEG